MELLEDAGVEYTDIKNKGNGYLIMLRNQWETKKILDHSGRPCVGAP
jgi:hypothetical protein